MAYDPTLQEDFELGGRFWLPQTPKEKIGGTLRYASGRVTLRLLGVFRSAPAGADSDDAEFILGSTERGPCTLWRSFRQEANTTIFGGEDSETGRSTWLANRLFLGAHFDDVGKMRFSESRFAFQELPAWIARRAFEVEFKEGGIATARHEFPPHIVVLSETMRARAARERALTPPSSQD